MLYAILILALVVLDQVVTFLVRAHIPLGGSLPFLPHILELTYVQNTGAAFSMLSQHTWLLTIVSAVVAVVIAAALVKKVVKHPFGVLSLSVVLAGAVGNLIDRVLNGYVVDFLYFSLIDFPVFNVADIYVTVSAFLLMFLFFFVYKENELSFIVFPALKGLQQMDKKSGDK